jgi:hypothetical protein
MLNPIEHARQEKDFASYKVEPYVVARPDRIGFSAPKVEQAIDARREVTNGLLVPLARNAPVRGQRALPFDLNGSVGGPTARMCTDRADSRTQAAHIEAEAEKPTARSIAWCPSKCSSI